MKPIYILQHLSGDGPAYLADWLQQQRLPFRVFNTQAGQDFPDTLRDCSGLAILGGEMSANDPLPSLRQAEHLFLQAVRDGIPTLGHCLGGQLMARALGAGVAASPAPEVGWQTLQLSGDEEARSWLVPQDMDPPPCVFTGTAKLSNCRLAPSCWPPRPLARYRPFRQGRTWRCSGMSNWTK